MKRSYLKRITTFSGTILGLLSLVAVPASAVAATSKTAATDAANQARLATIINRGNTEITRRLTTLNTLSGKISAATKLTAADKSALSDEVSAEITGLTNLKTKLDAGTDVTTAKADAQSIFNDYRVYALVVPKVDLVKTADDQQVIEAKLTALAVKLQARITTAQTAGKNVTSLQADLTDLNAKVTAAQTISSSIESKVAGLQPSDYNSDHSLLSGDRDQLKTAQTNIQAATTDARNIVTGLKNL